MRSVLPPAVHQLAFFAASGVAGLVVDTTILYLLAPVIGPFLGRVVSFLAAVVTTWLVNRTLTFAQRSSALSRRAELIRYFLLMLVGGVVNYGVYSLMVLHWPVVQQHLVVGVAAGSMAGMVVNFLSTRFLLYRFQRPTQS